MIEKDLLHRRRCDLAFRVALGYAFNGANALAIKELGIDDAARHLHARVIVLVPDHHASMADAFAAAEPRAGKAQHLVQHVNHHRADRHVQRTVRRVVHGDCQGTRRNAHDSTFRMSSAVTGVSRKRCPVAWAIALTRAGMIGIIVTSAMPFGGSVSDSAGSTSAVCRHTATSLARGM